MSSNEIHDRAFPMCARLREERLKTGLDQKDFADLVGIKPRTYMTYENKVTIPSDKLGQIAKTSAIDILYVLTGQKSVLTNKKADTSNTLDREALKRGTKKFLEETLLLKWVLIPKNVDEKMVADFLEFCIRSEHGEQAEFERPSETHNRKTVN